MGAPPPLKGEGMHFSSGRSAPTFFGWTPGLRHLVSGRLLACGCLVGLYETWDRSFVEIVDSIVEPCGVGHDVNHVLMIKKLRPSERTFLQDVLDTRTVPHERQHLERREDNTSQRV